MDFPLSCTVDSTHALFAWGVNKNLNCQNLGQQPHRSTLSHDSLSCREYQLRWHLMRIIIIVRLHVYFRFCCFKYEACLTLSRSLFLSPYTHVHTNTKSMALCHCLWSLWLCYGAVAAPLISLYQTFLLVLLPTLSLSLYSSSSWSSTSVILLLSWIKTLIWHLSEIAALWWHPHASITADTCTVADPRRSSAKIPCTIKGKGLSVTHGGRLWAWVTGDEWH